MDNSNGQQQTTEGQDQCSHQSQVHNNMQSLTPPNSDNINPNSHLLKGPFDSTSANSATAAAMNFFQPQGHSRRSSDNDIGTMDDIQFTASLDALLNGEQITVSNHGAASLTVDNVATHNNNDLFSSRATTMQQAPFMNPRQFVLTGFVGTPAPLDAVPQQAAAPTQQNTISFSTTQLAGLPLASANQGMLQLVPTGPHSAAQMSLSAGHAAATGGFHPSSAFTTNPAPVLPYNVVATQPTFPWVISGEPASSTVSVVTDMMKPPPSASKSSATASRGGKRARMAPEVDVSAVSEDEGDRERRRQERNQREQQRSHRITEQIATLREVLSSANIPFKADKYSTLTKVADYIQELQDRSKLLDIEHKRLLNTIAETNEIVNNQYVPAYTSGSDSPSIANDVISGQDFSSAVEEESLAYVRGIDYKLAFTGCGIPMSLASIDGRFLDCNEAFLELTGYTREELLPLEQPGRAKTVSFSPDQGNSQKKNLSLFNLLSRDGMDQVFMAMGEMLKQPGSIGNDAVNATQTITLGDFWSGPIKLCRQDDLPVTLNVTLVRTSRGRPKFFNCALTALNAEKGLRFDDQTTITTPSQSASDAARETSKSGDKLDAPCGGAKQV